MTTNSQLALQIAQLLTRWNDREAQLASWMAGATDGGPNGDGKFPLTDASGRSYLAPSLLKLADTVEGPAGLSLAAQLLAEGARDAAITARSETLTYRNNSEGFRNEALTFRDLALLYSNNAAADAAGLAGAVDTATDAADVATLARQDTLDARDVTLDAREDALLARFDAQTAATLAQGYAASIDPSTLVNFDDLDWRIDQLIGGAPGALNALNELAAAIGNDPNFATTITNSIATKAPLVHAHALGDVTGLQTALNGKSDLGHTHSYLSSSGGTIAGNLTMNHTGVSGDQYLTMEAPDGKYRLLQFVAGGVNQFSFGTDTSGGFAVNRYGYDGQWKEQTFWINRNNGTITFNVDTAIAAGKALTVGGVAVSLTGHTHTIANVTGLQGALDGKQALLAFSGSGARWSVTAGVASDGVMEIGKYLDFHETSGSTADFSVRLTATGGTLYASGTLNVPALIANGRNVLTDIDGKASLSYVDTNFTKWADLAYGLDQRLPKTGGQLSGSLQFTGASERTITFDSSGAYFYGNSVNLGIYSPNGGSHLRFEAATGNLFTNGNITGRDVYASRGDGTGVYYFGTSGSKYLYFDTVTFHLAGGNLAVNDGELYVRGTRVPKTTISTAAPSGGANGDVWFKV